MAIQKEIKLRNGITLNYHRIGSLTKVTNIVNTIEVNSYVDVSTREKEKTYQNLQTKNANGEDLSKEEQDELNRGIYILVEADFITIPYKQSMTIKQAYDYLKTTEKYKDAENI